MAAEVTLDGLQDYRARFQTSCGHYLCPFLPRRWEEIFALGFTVREDDVAIVIDARALRNLGIRLGALPGTPVPPSTYPPPIRGPPNVCFRRQRPNV